MKLIHKGKSPTHPLVVLDFKRKIYIEEFPDGTYKIWNKKLLRVGCYRRITEFKKLNGCIYCPHCDEWFSLDHWEEVT
jgi:hypothetical protein